MSHAVVPAPTAPAASVRPLLPSDPPTVGDWTLLGRIGSGGMCATYAAHSPTGRPAVVKVLTEQLHDDPLARQRFARELDVLRALDGRHTAPVLDADMDLAQPYIVLEHLDGPTVTERVAASGPLPPADVHALARDLATALVAIHAEGIVHRDLKPSNVILTPEGARLIDFGIAYVHDATSLTKTDFVIGSPGWIAPEELTGRAVGTPADVFGWGAVVAFAATGRPPFGRGRPESTLYAVLHHDPDLSGLPADLEPLVAAALRAEPATRPTTPELLTGEGAWAAIVPPPRTPTMPTQLTRRRRPRRGAALLATLAVLLGGAGVGWAVATSDDGGAQVAAPATDAPPQITLSCTPTLDPNTRGRVQYGHTYQVSTDTFTVRVDYGDGSSYTSSSSPADVESAFWHDYDRAGTYGPVTATIVDGEGRTAVATCGAVDVPVGTDDVRPSRPSRPQTPAPPVQPETPPVEPEEPPVEPEQPPTDPEQPPTDPQQPQTDGATPPM